MKLKPLWPIALAFISLSATAQTQAPAPAKGTLTGQQVYQKACMACHDSGVAHAPKFRDAKDWAPLIAEGQNIITAHGWVGVRAMPAKGGDPDLTLPEFARAVAYMVREAGTPWRDPDDAMMVRIVDEAETRLDKSITDSLQMKNDLFLLAAPLRAPAKK